MSLFTKLGNDIASPVDASGNLRSVDNADMQRWMTEAERLLAAQSMGAVTFGTLAQANASLAYDPWTTAWVLNDPVIANNGWYTKTGASGAGGWVRLGDLPYCYIRATNAGAGSANAIVATTTMPIPVADGGALISLNITSSNTATPVTVSFNGAPPLTIKTNAGNNPVIGGLVAGAVLAGYKAGTEFRLLSDQASAAIVAAAEAAQLAAEAARDEALAAVPNVFPATIAALRLVDTDAHSAAIVMSDDGDVFNLVSPTLKLQSQMVVKTVSVAHVDAATDTFRMGEVVTATFDAVTNTFTSAGHTFVALQQVIIPATRNAFQGGGLYYIGSDVTGSTFRLYTSVGTAQAAGTSGLVQIGVKSTSVVSNTISKIGHGWADGTLVRVAEAVNGLSTTTDYYTKTDNVNNYKLSLTPGGPDVVLTGTDPVITYQPGNMTIRQPHNMFTGYGLTLDADANGVTAGDVVYFIAIDQCYGKLAETFEDAMEGNAIDLTGDDVFTFHHLADPREGRWVIPTGASRTGTDKVWQRATGRVEGRHFGIVADGPSGTDNSAAVQAAINLAYFLKKKKVYFGAYEDWIALKYQVGHYTHSNLSVGGVLRPGNGLTIQGEGSEATRFFVHVGSTNTGGCVVLDGNFWGVSHVVGSNPMNQGYTELRGIAIRGPGKDAGGTLSGLKTRGIWRLGLFDVDIHNFPRDGWEVFSAAPVGPPANDDVDSTAWVNAVDLRVSNNGGHGKSAVRARVASGVFTNCEFERNGNCGAFGCWINCVYVKPAVVANGQRAIPSSGGMRFQGSESGAISRDVTLIGGTYENNFNYEINIVNTRNFRMYGGGLNLYAPADAATNGLATNQAAIRIGTGNSGYVFEGQIFTTNVTTYGDIWCFDIASTSPHGRIRMPYFAGATSHLRLQSGNDVVIEGSNVAPSVTLTGSSPVDCLVGDTPLGTISDAQALTPVLTGQSSGGVRTGGAATGTFLLRDNRMEFSVDYSQTSHSGTGGITITLSDLPRNFVETAPVDMYFEGLTYTSPPMAIAVGGTKTVVLRQAASGAAYSVISVPAGAATIRLRGSVR